MAGFRVLHVPGHSAGHVAFWRESDRVLVLGDVLNNMDVVTGLPGLRDPKPYLTPDPAENRRSARKLAALEPVARGLRARRAAARHGQVREVRRGAAGLMEVSASGIVPAPPERVWELLCDTSRYAEWVDGTEAVTRTDGPAAPGSTYDEVNPVLGPWKAKSKWTVTEFEAPRRQVHSGTGLPLTSEFLVIFELAPEGDATGFSLTSGPRPGWGRWAVPSRR